MIARLDPSLLQAQVDQASATVVRLEADVERARVNVDDAEVKLGRARQLQQAGLMNELRARLDYQTALADFERAQTAP